MSVWEQRQNNAPLAGWPASQGRERQPSVAAGGILEALCFKKSYLRTTSFGCNKPFSSPAGMFPRWNGLDESSLKDGNRLIHPFPSGENGLL